MTLAIDLTDGRGLSNKAHCVLLLKKSKVQYRSKTTLHSFVCTLSPLACSILLTLFTPLVLFPLSITECLIDNDQV